MKNTKAKGKPAQQKHSVFTLAAIFGISRERLTRALVDSGLPTVGEMTVAKAFSALSARFQKQETLSRRQEAEADSAEMDAAEKKGLLMLKKDARLIWADATIEIRKVVQSKDKWGAKELLLALSKIKPEVAK